MPYNPSSDMETRTISLEGTLNTRDLGGLKTKDGRRIRKNLLIRTDCLYRLTKKDVETLSRKYHALYDIDFRNDRERKDRPEVPIPHCTIINLSITNDHNMGITPPPHETYGITKTRMLTLFDFIYCLSKDANIKKGMEKSYRNYVSSPLGQEGYSRFLHLVLEANGKGAVLFHCADGKDRAGIATYLLLKTLGVEDKTILEDYLLTNESVKEKKEKRYKALSLYGVKEPLLSSAVMLAGVEENWLQAAMDCIEKDFGSFDNYRRERLHFSDEEQKRLRDIYLED